MGDGDGWGRESMKTIGRLQFATIVWLGVVCNASALASANSVSAESDPRTNMSICQEKAEARRGDERKQFVTECLRTTYAERMTDVDRMREAQSRAGSPKQFVNAIKSVATVKEYLRDLVTESRQCLTGSCWNMTSGAICTYVGALDVRVDYLITGTFKPKERKPEIPISEADILLMRLIFSQCRPTNYQYQNYPTILHVVYEPNKKIGAQIAEALGVKNER